MMNNIFDTHAHYDDDRFADCLDAVLSENAQNGVVGIINCAVDYASAERLRALAEQYDFCHFAAGVHPENIPSHSVDTEPLYPLLQHKKAVAVGEIGLDYHWEDCAPKEVQREWFCAQLQVANELDLPAIIHDRDAHADTLEILRQYRPKGVLHCFSGSAEMAREITDLGLYIGLGGVVTFKNARKALEVAAAVPMDRLLLETDAPYMAPEPFRGKTNLSHYIAYVAKAIGEARGIEAQAVLDACRENARRLFGV